MNREEALELVKQNIKNQNLFKHVLAVEAIMKELAKRFGEDEELWGLVGLLHDLDYEKTMDEPMKHGLLTAEMLKGKVPEEVLNAIRSHNHEYTGFKPQTRMDKALIAADAISGLIVACALVMPDKKLSSVKVKTVKKKFKQKDFARRVNRENIRMCEEIGLSLEEFFELALKALQRISDELDL
ncbi:MAG: HDIG domain-containing protein [Candidatus Aenigmarchaeota archaeon]|nr:HDIG domain-containing protein [Candidatus Aenigmarchaeota archaeon]